jgi:hypothetical protein
MKVEESKVDSNVKRINGKSADLGKEVGVIRENSDVSLRRRGERVEQMQLRVHEEKVTVENKVKKLHAQTTELRDLALAVPRTLNSDSENVTNSNNVDAQLTTCSLVSTIGNVSRVVSMNSNPDSISVKPQIACSGLGNPEFSVPLFGDNQEISPMFHAKRLRESFHISMPEKFYSYKLGLQRSDRRRNKSQEKCRHLARYNPMR